MNDTNATPAATRTWPTIAEVVRQSVEYRSRGFRQIQAKDFKPGMFAVLWTETGDGHLRRVQYIRADGWIVTGGTGAFDQQSWCCCPDTPLYLPGDYQTCCAWESAMQKALKENRRG